jgi:hypothetical protein
LLCVPFINIKLSCTQQARRSSGCKNEHTTNYVYLFFIASFGESALYQYAVTVVAQNNNSRQAQCMMTGNKLGFSTVVNFITDETQQAFSIVDILSPF